MENENSLIPSNIVVPPQDVRILIGKTATYVNKNGTAFENKIRSKESNNPKFIFLNEKDPYYEYYRYSLDTIKRTGKPPVIEKRVADEINTENSDNSDTTEKQLESIVEPYKYKFLEFNGNILSFPEDKISNTDLEVIKLVAQFKVINNAEIFQTFKEKVTTNDKISAQFEFLNENHSLHKIFEKYCNIYNFIKNGKDEIIKVYGEPMNKKIFLERCFQRAEYLEKMKLTFKKSEDERLREKQLYGSIDWNNFEIIETVEFTEFDEIASLNKPINKSDLEYRSLMDKGLNDLFAEAKTEEELVIDEHEEDGGEEIPQYQDNEDDDNKDDVKSNNNVLEDTKSVKKIPKGMKVKAAGESRLLKRKFQQVDAEHAIDPITNEKLFKCPITNKLIPESKFQTHISTILRDPKYEEEKARYDSKFKYGSNLNTSQVYENIKSLFDDDNSKKQKQ